MSIARLTFRSKANGVCWQKLLRDSHMQEGTPDVDLSLKRAIVRPISRKMAEQVILKYEWLGTMAQSSKHFGIFFGPHCAGVTCVGTCCTGGANTPLMFRIQPHELGVLARGACVHWAPAGSNSKLVSWTRRLLAGGDMKLLVAYADSDAGEIGTIYQASGWAFVGVGSATRQWVSPLGRVMDQMLPRDMARRHGRTRTHWCQYLRDAGWREQQSNPKGRYAAVLDKTDSQLVRRIAEMSQPYPKRAGSAASGTSDHQSEGGGATPTPALKTKEVA